MGNYQKIIKRKGYYFKNKSLLLKFIREAEKVGSPHNTPEENILIMEKKYADKIKKKKEELINFFFTAKGMATLAGSKFYITKAEDLVGLATEYVLTRKLNWWVTMLNKNMSLKELTWIVTRNVASIARIRYFGLNRTLEREDLQEVYEACDSLPAVVQEDKSYTLNSVAQLSPSQARDKFENIVTQLLTDNPNRLKRIAFGSVQDVGDEELSEVLERAREALEDQISDAKFKKKMSKKRRVK